MNGSKQNIHFSQWKCSLRAAARPIPRSCLRAQPSLSGDDPLLISFSWQRFHWTLMAYFSAAGCPAAQMMRPQQLGLSSRNLRGRPFIWSYPYFQASHGFCRIHLVTTHRLESQRYLNMQYRSPYWGLPLRLDQKLWACPVVRPPFM